MSKSLGNFSTLPDLLSRSDARAYRLLVLRAHYRSPIEVTPETLADAEKALGRLDGLARRFDVAELLARTPEGYVVEGTPPAVGIDPDALATFRTHMDDDLDTPGALAGIFELVTAAHSAADAGDEDEGARLAQTRRGARRRARAVAPSGGYRRRRGVGSAGGRARRGPPCQGLRPGRRPAGRAGRPRAGPSRTPRAAPPSAADRAENPRSTAIFQGGWIRVGS